MNQYIPELTSPPEGLALKVASKFSKGVSVVQEQVRPYTTWWNNNNQKINQNVKPLMVAIGDSSALGIGASKPEKSYVYLIKKYLEDRDKQSWQLLNLAQSGAKVEDAFDKFLPTLENLKKPDVVICCIGSNNIFWSWWKKDLHKNLELLVEQLPQHSIIGLLAGASPTAAAANRFIKKKAKERSMRVVMPWNLTSPNGKVRLAEDKFHPNDHGYELMAEAFISVLKESSDNLSNDE